MPRLVFLPHGLAGGGHAGEHPRADARTRTGQTDGGDLGTAGESRSPPSVPGGIGMDVADLQRVQLGEAQAAR